MQNYRFVRKNNSYLINLLLGHKKTDGVPSVFFKLNRHRQCVPTGLFHQDLLGDAVKFDEIETLGQFHNRLTFDIPGENRLAE